MTHIISFVFGAVLMKSHWQHAYQVGRDDGYTLGKAEYELTHEQMVYECERLHWEMLDGKQR